MNHANRRRLGRSDAPKGFALLSSRAAAAIPPEPKKLRCSTCKQCKPVTDFYRDPQSQSGYRYQCKSCASKRMKEYRERNATTLRRKKRDYYQKHRPERLRYNRQYYELHREELVRSYRQYRQEHLGQFQRRDRKTYYTQEGKARSILRHNVRLGRIHKPRICSECNSRVEPRGLHGHHEDHSKPLHIQWLCGPCHAKVHRKYA